MMQMCKIDLNYIKYLYYNKNFDYLIKTAENICLNIYGKKVFLRGLLEFSNICYNNCLYCGIRKDNKKIERYFIDFKQILRFIDLNYEVGFRTFVLQSGEFINDISKLKSLCDMIKKLKKKYKDIAITLSCGYFKKKYLKILKDYGVDRYLIRFEVADDKIYSYLKNGINLKNRIEMLYNLKELGFETGSGFMIGLPYETNETIFKNIKLCYDLDLDMIGIGPFIPNSDTPLSSYDLPDFNKIIKITSILRIILPFANMPATTASGTIEKNGREKLLKAGANVLMPNITPPEYKRKYLLYPNKICLSEKISECIICLKERLNKIDRELSFEIGTSLNYLKKKEDKNVYNEHSFSRTN